MSEKNKALIHQYWQKLSGKDKPAAIVGEYVVDEKLKQHIAFFESAFPHYEVIAEDAIAEKDYVTVRGRFQGTHKGNLMGIPPTGKYVSLPFLIIYRIAEDKIVDHWMGLDRLELIEQLGVKISIEQNGS